MEISAGMFKAKCLSLMDEVAKTHREIVITKFGRPVAKLVPIEEKKPRSWFGCMQGSLIIKGDIIAPIDEKWSADE
jgi:prevent-host-death family protein